MTQVTCQPCKFSQGFHSPTNFLNIIHDGTAKLECSPNQSRLESLNWHFKILASFISLIEVGNLENITLTCKCMRDVGKVHCTILYQNTRCVVCVWGGGEGHNELLPWWFWLDNSPSMAHSLLSEGIVSPNDERILHTCNVGTGQHSRTLKPKQQVLVC